jgi:uncharacterized membrane protein
VSESNERGLERLVFFSDAVVAIALTLLILPLTDVEIDAGQTLGELLQDNSGKLLAFGISFVVIARYWMAHHGIFKDVRSHDGRLLNLNIAWLAAIAVLPFPSAMIAQQLTGGFDSLYLANLLAASGLTLLLSLYLTRHPELTVDPASAREHVTAGWFLVAPMAVALIISFFTDSGALWALLLLIPAQAIGSRLGRRAAPATEAV